MAIGEVAVGEENGMIPNAPLRFLVVRSGETRERIYLDMQKLTDKGTVELINNCFQYLDVRMSFGCATSLQSTCGFLHSAHP